MAEKHSWMWISAGLLCIVIIASSFGGYYYGEFVKYRDLYQETLKDLENVSMHVSVLINYGNGTKEWYNNTLVPIGFSVLNTTLIVAKVNYTIYPTMGAFVTAINDVAATGAMWWSLWHWNSTSSQWMFSWETSDQLILHNEDIIAWYCTSEGFPPTQHPS